MRLVGALAALLVVLAAASQALAAHVHLTASPSRVSPGGVVTVGAPSSPCLRGDQVTLISAAFPGHAFGEGAVYGHAGRYGAFSIRAHVRSHLSPGRYHVSVRCGGGNLGVLAWFRVR
jgi:hypothetical protein